MKVKNNNYKKYVVKKVKTTYSRRKATLIELTEVSCQQHRHACKHNMVASLAAIRMGHYCSAVKKYIIVDPATFTCSCSVWNTRSTRLWTRYVSKRVREHILMTKYTALKQINANDTRIMLSTLSK